MDKTTWDDRYEHVHEVYLASWRRADRSNYTRSTRLRRQGAARRFRVSLRALQIECGCQGCLESLSLAKVAS